MGNIVPMDSKLLSNYWYMSWPSWPTHISKLCSHKIRAEPPPPPPPLNISKSLMIWRCLSQPEVLQELLENAFPCIWNFKLIFVNNFWPRVEYKKLKSANINFYVFYSILWLFMIFMGFIVYIKTFVLEDYLSTCCGNLFVNPWASGLVINCNYQLGLRYHW